MPRINRQISDTRVYHVILRGIDKQDIFLEEMDYKVLLKILKELQKKYQYEIYAYCFMNNHIHLVIYDIDNQLSKIMQSIGIRYSNYFNKRYERAGHLFQNRFLSKNVEDREYLKGLCRYIHKNPQKAQIRKMEEYKWSSYHEYINKAELINPKMLLDVFLYNKEEFIKFHNIDNDLKENIKYEINEILDDIEVQKYICKILKLQNIREIISFQKEKRNEILVKCKSIVGVSNRQLARVIGINRKIVDRAK